MNNGGAASWHIGKVAGSDIVYTCPPGYIGELMEVEDKLNGFEPDTIYEESPKATLEKLTRLSCIAKAYEPDGTTKREFNRQGALVATTAELAKAARSMVAVVAHQFWAPGKN